MCWARLNKSLLFCRRLGSTHTPLFPSVANHVLLFDAFFQLPSKGLPEPGADRFRTQ
ncbi:hypothetical protein ACSS6W_001373 [Trichoderma asperelloides]